MKKLINHFRAIFAIAIMLSVALPSLAYDFEVDGIYYNITDATAKTVEVTYKGSSSESYNEYSGTVTIPSSVTYSGTTYSVTQIGFAAFAHCSELTSVTIPNSVSTISVSAFNCTNFAQIKVESGNTKYDSRNGCNAIIETSTNTLIVGCKNSIIPNSVTSIGDNAFNGCLGLTSVNIPNSVTSIGYKAFEGCSSLTSITIPKSVIKIDYSFRNCTSLTQIKVESGNPNYDSRNDCNAIIETKTNALIAGCKNTIIPNSVTKIGSYAFLGSGLLDPKIPLSVTDIGYAVFNDSEWYKNQSDGVLYLDNCCVGYKSEAPSGVLNIKKSTRLICSCAFWGSYDSLTDVIIPNSVKYIYFDTFKKCNGIKTIKSLSQEPPICIVDYADWFLDIPGSCILQIPAGSKEAYSTAIGWGRFVNIEEIATVDVSTQENNATFEIPTAQGAVTYTVNVYSDEAMTQLVATTNYDATGKIIPMATSLELSIDGFEDGTYYYDVVAKSETGETLSNYTGTFEIDAAGISQVEADNNTTEIARYDIHGRLLIEPTKGINIIKMSDGSTRKEFVK